MRHPLRPLFLALVACALPSLGKVLLQPAGGSAQPLRATTVTATAVVEGPVAATAMVLTFANESDERIEADFLYELPPHAVPTYFAYWYGKEKVVARIADKERAQAIYHYITSRMRDPALVEMQDSRTLRARIFPVMPNSDLRVEVHFVQALPFAPGNAAVYAMPLEQPEGETLERLDVSVRVKGWPGLASVTNNYGLPVEPRDGDTLLELKGENYRPPKDLRVQLRYGDSFPGVLLYSARSGGTEGYFTLAVTPPSALRRPRVRIAGVWTGDLTPLPAAVKAGEAIFLHGRYRGSGPVTIVVTGQGENGAGRITAGVRFDARAAPDNPAALLWASGRMAALSAGGKHVAAVKVLSRRFNIPGKYTSWIAIPREERARYRQEMARAEASLLARRLTQLITSGRGSTRQARVLRAQLAARCRACDEQPEWLLREELHSRTYQLANDLAWLVQRGQEHSRDAVRVRRELTMLARHSGQDVGDLVRDHLWSNFYTLAEQVVDEQHRAAPRPKVLARLRGELQRLAHVTHGRIGDYLHGAEDRWTWREAERVRGRLIAELRRDAPDPGQVEKLRLDLLQLFTATEGSAGGARVRVERIVARSMAEQFERRIAGLQDADQPVPETLQAQAVQQRRRENELRVRMGDPLIVADAPADARSVTALLPDGTVKMLHWNRDGKRWEARFDVPAYARSGDYRIVIIVVRKDGMRQTITMPYIVDVTPPEGAAVIRVVRAPELALRIDLQSSEDTARVTALLPGDRRVDLLRMAPGRFFALIPLSSGQPIPARVELMLTDRAHNRGMLTAAVEGK